MLISEFERDPLRGAFPGDPRPEHDPIGHLELAANCDAYLVAPASANTLAKLAAGAADSMLTTSFLACAAPRLVAPAMNDRMLRRRRDPGQPGDPARARRHRDRARGGARSPRAASSAAAGCPTRPGCSPGSNRCCPPATRPWDGLRVLVTAGGTREPVDPVRFLGNRSSGRMGFALAAAAARRGADVTLIAANVSLPEPAGVRRIDVETAAELAAAARAEFAASHVLVMAAAPADFRAAEVAPGKLAARGLARAAAGADRGHPRRPRRGPRPRRRRSSASPPSTARAASSAPAPSSSARAPT